MLTYRDNCYWSFYDERQFQFPAKNLYNHDPIYGQAGTSLRGALDDDYFRTFLFGCAMRGTAFFELYYTYDMLDEGDKWYVNSDVLTWAEKNFDTLQHSQRFGGQPAKGDVYGFSAWNKNDGIVALRHPGDGVKEFSIVLDRNVGVTEGLSKVYRSTKLQHKTTATDEIKNGVEYNYGDTLKVTLQPGEYRIYEFHEKIDEEAPIIEVVKATKEGEIDVRFNKYVVLSPDSFAIDGLTINDVTIRGDLRTVTLKTSPMTENQIYTLKVKDVENIFGFKLTTTYDFQYFIDNTIVNLRGEFSGADAVILDQNVQTDSFTIRLSIKDYKDVKTGVLLHSKDNSIVVELVEGKVKFTVGQVSVTSESTISEKINFITLVRERNALIKIYLNSDIDASEWNKEMPILETLHDIVLNKNAIVYSYVKIINFGLAYSEIPLEISLKNKYLERVFHIVNDKLTTSEIINYRTEPISSLIPQAGSEEWVFTIPAFPERKKPAPIDRKDWKVTANSEQSTSPGSEGAAVNLIDGNLNTIWHSKYDDKGAGGHDDRKNPTDPFQITFDLGSVKKFKAFSHAPRKNGGNGVIRHFEIYVAMTKEELDTKIAENKYEMKGDFTYLDYLPVYLNFTKEEEGQFVAFVVVNHDKLGSGADFSLYEDFVPLPYEEIKSSETEIESYDLQKIENGQKLVFTYKPHEFNKVQYNVTVTYTLQDSKHYLEKQVTIAVPKDKRSLAKIDHIDLESFVLSAGDISKSWTHPVRDEDPDSGLNPFIINLGQPIYINTLFTGCRFPLNDNAIESGNARLRYHSGKTFEQLELTDDKYVCWKTVLGAARSGRLEVVRNDFFSFISDISVETKFRTQFNSWYDWMLKIDESNILESFKAIERGCSQYGVPPLDSYVVDDGWNNYNTEKYGVHNKDISGDTDNQDGFWEFNSKFPNGLTKPSKFAHSISSNFGVWLGPRGGYVTPGEFGKVIQDAGKGFHNAQSGDIDVGSVKYIKRLNDFLTTWITDYKINYFKLDGFASKGCTNTTHDHMVGGIGGVYYFTDLWERYEKVFENLREVAIANNVIDLWISITCFVNPSPFHLQWANSVFIQLSGDVGYVDIGGNKGLADQMLTYRDACYYQFYEFFQFQFPQRCIYNHDPIYGKAGTQLEGSLDDEEFRLFLYFCAMRGNAFVEMYYTYTMLDEGQKWYVNAEVLRYIKNRFEVLQHSQIFGSGDPKLGEVYGYSAWNDKAGTIAIRNPSGEEKKYTIKLDRDIGVPENIPTTYRKIVLAHKTNESLEEGKETHYNDEIVCTLQPGEARIIDFDAVLDTAAPIVEVVKTVDANKILVRFNEKIVKVKKQFKVKGLKVSSVVMKADLRTAVIYVEQNMTNATEYTVELKGIKRPNSKDGLSTSIKVKYFEGNNIFNIPSSITPSSDITLSKDEINTDSFTIQFTISNPQNGVLFSTTDSKITGEIVDNKVKFTVGKLSVVSNEEVKNSDTLTFVLERNTMIKILINGEISNSNYNEGETSPISLTVTLKGFILHKSDITYTNFVCSNNGYLYNEPDDGDVPPEPDDGDDDDDDDDDNSESKTWIVIGSSLSVISLIVIIVIIFVLCRRKREGYEGIRSTPLLTQEK